ncbi:molybdenum cofactor guanylyltransferase MobA [Neomegalonema sp.]|uniref:molybdenum cofactor guanylyltransferase MobA n=1 Tax=Neomegalonema sp. TaxID=2039713 RepID=UPI002616A7AC|nr:molybdenum cofactor guanylyltransferase MobA [Neomegalonema sp.]MDD2868467.1 molybdenum cofactor guanylyltransferase MobA [Neomegalonema sp.]
MREETLGVILAGGLARRMGGGDKGRLDLGGRTLIAEIVARMDPQCAALILNANGAPERFEDLGLKVAPDGIPGFLGPLAGILAGMDQAAELGLPLILTAASDTPFLPRDLGARLAEAAAREGLPVALAATRVEGRLAPHPTFGLWPVALREDLRAALGAGVTRVRSWAEGHGAALAEFPTEPLDPFFNLNHPADLAQARRLWQKLRSE